MERPPIVVGMLGVGVVGSGVARILADKRELLEAEVGRPVLLKRALVRDPGKERPVSLPPGTLTTCPEDVIDDPEVDIVVELLGREEPPYQYVKRALRNGKHVVTANKDVMALHGVEILQLAEACGVDVYYEASVGGGIPLIGSFRQDLVANEIHQIHAILNGTTNYILTRMARDGLDFGDALREAQALGYAESDPSNDVDAVDPAYKLSILASIAFQTRVSPHDVYREGIRSIRAADFRYAQEMGYAIKLLAIAKRDRSGAPRGAIEARVHPVLVRSDSVLADVHGGFNAVHVQGDLVGPVLFYGQGAGSLPTASAIVADIVDVVHNINAGVANRISFRYAGDCAIKPMGAVVSRYYFRMWVADRPGVLAQIARTFGDHEISIASVIQKETDLSTGGAELVIMTHPAREGQVQEALRQIAALSVVHEVAACIRIEDIEP